MRLLDLEPQFIRRTIEPCCVGTPGCNVVSPHTEHEVLYNVDSISLAHGIMFLCPVCFKANNGSVGTHSIICWRPMVPPNVDPKPGRWELQGTNLSDLTLVAGSSSILIQGGCNAHFFIRNGMIEGC